MNKQNNRIQFTVQMPSNYFRQEDIDLFKNNKLNRMRTRASTSISNFETERDCNENTAKSNYNSKKSGRHLKCNQSEQNLFDLNREEFSSNKNKYKPMSFRDCSLHSLSSYNELNRQYEEENKIKTQNDCGVNCSIFFVVLIFLMNPIFGK